MKVLVACEFSGRVRDAFTAMGHDATSCDLLPTEKPGNHYQGDVRDLFSEHWDLMIAHPDCTYLSYAATAHWNKPGRAEKRTAAMAFFMEMINAQIDKICVENPVGYPNTVYRKPDQIIHPYYFGDWYMKRTCLWLKNLQPLRYEKPVLKPQPLYICQGKKCKGKRINWCEGIKDRTGKNRSRTFKGIAQAMAEQWGRLSDSRTP